MLRRFLGLIPNPVFDGVRARLTRGNARTTQTLTHDKNVSSDEWTNDKTGRAYVGGWMCVCEKTSGENNGKILIMHYHFINCAEIRVARHLPCCALHVCVCDAVDTDETPSMLWSRSLLQFHFMHWMRIENVKIILYVRVMCWSTSVPGSGYYVPRFTFHVRCSASSMLYNANIYIAEIGFECDSIQCS